MHLSEEVKHACLKADKTASDTFPSKHPRSPNHSQEQIAADAFLWPKICFRCGSIRWTEMSEICFRCGRIRWTEMSEDPTRQDVT